MNFDKLYYKGNKSGFMKELEGYCKRNNMDKLNSDQRESVWRQLQNMSNPMIFDFKIAYDKAISNS